MHRQDDDSTPEEEARSSSLHEQAKAIKGKVTEVKRKKQRQEILINAIIINQVGN